MNKIIFHFILTFNSANLLMSHLKSSQVKDVENDDTNDSDGWDGVGCIGDIVFNIKKKLK